MSPDDVNATNGEPATGEPTATLAKPAAQSEAETKLAEIGQCEREVAAAEERLNAAKEVVKELKAVWEQQVAGLQRLIRQSTESLPLFDSLVPPRVAAEAWRSVRLDTLGLSAGIVAALSEAGIVTIGDVSDWSQQSRQLTEVKGIGEGKAEQVREAISRYWDEHPAEGEGEDGGEDAQDSTTNGAPDSWRDDNVGQLDLDNRLWIEITDLGIETCGQLADRMSRLAVDTDLTGTDIDTIGQELAVHRGRKGSAKTAGAAGAAG